MKLSMTDYLARERLANIDMIELILLPETQALRFDEEGLLLYRDGLYLLACEPGKGCSFLPLLTRGLTEGAERLIVLRGEETIEPLVRDYGFQVVMDCVHAVYPAKEPLRYTLPENAEIRPLDPCHAGFVHEHYHMVDDIAYIRERIRAGMYGAFVGGYLAGFVGTHDEGSIGMLEVLPEFRRLGLAYALEAHLINRLLESGHTPYCQVSIKNEPSIALQRKLGMEFSSAVIHWLAYGRTR